MSPTASYRETIRNALADRAGDAPDANAVAEAAIGTWMQMAAQITPVIGAGGIEVLFKRSLHLTCTAFPWLAIPGDHRDSAAVLAKLKERLAGREPDSAAGASHALLVTFVELLMSMIGDSLTDRLLSQVWEPWLPPSEQENKS